MHWTFIIYNTSKKITFRSAVVILENRWDLRRLGDKNREILTPEGKGVSLCRTCKLKCLQGPLGSTSVWSGKLKKIGLSYLCCEEQSTCLKWWILTSCHCCGFTTQHCRVQTEWPNKNIRGHHFGTSVISHGVL